MRATPTVFRTGALLLALTLLCGCGKKGRLYLPSEQDDDAQSRVIRVQMMLPA